MDRHVLVTADTSSTPENADEFGRILQKFAHACRAEPGCLSYEIFRSVDQPERYLSIERYADKEAFTTHRSSAHFRQIGLGEVLPLVVARDIRMYDAPLDVPPIQ
ncbi:antibiotic biosynthesis monooxygenase family protein [Kribbella sp.]|uniref:putative quinol monooxygenase n=1 Tax=Kribbella sp. TaxID=1871183 RepID=UPI002D441A86|nr:antibiotic biosynthesis monooxygenase family protein [Kribbella sp.]HZX08345.1 antibiotic biosynthesis monooxygenase family protein [Kribbella sp.]